MSSAISLQDIPRFFGIIIVGQINIMTIRQFRIFLSLSWIFGLLGMALSFLTIYTLPIELRDFLKTQTNTMATTRDIIYFVSGFPLIIGVIVAYIGLYLWKNWARILFICIFLYSFFVQLLGNAPSIVSPIAEPITISFYVLSGIVICSIYFCEKIKNQFIEEFKAQQRHSL